VDDAAFARRWVEARAARGYGASRLRAELSARGVARDVVDLALGALVAETTLERARELARRRLPGLRRRPDRAATRLRDYLLRRGYAAAVVARVVREFLGDRPEAGSEAK
jgi:regulatory protein